jgi:hypothetical protein
MTDLELIHAVYAYYNDDQPFSYTIAGMLDTRKDLNSDWSALRDAYINGEFYPDDVRFMISYMEY